MSPIFAHQSFVLFLTSNLNMSWTNDSFASLLMKSIMFYVCSPSESPYAEPIEEFDESVMNVEALFSWFQTLPVEKEKLCKMLAVLFTDTTHTFHIDDEDKVKSWVKQNINLPIIVENIGNIDVKDGSGKLEKLGRYTDRVPYLGDPQQNIAQNLETLYADQNSTDSGPPHLLRKLTMVLPRCFAILWCMQDTDWSMQMYRDESLLNEQRRRNFLDRLAALFQRKPAQLTMPTLRKIFDFQWLSWMQSIQKGSDVVLTTEQRKDVPRLEAEVLSLLDSKQLPEALRHPFTRMYLWESIKFTKQIRTEISRSNTLIFIGATTTGKTQQIETLFEESGLGNPTAVQEEFTTDVLLYTYCHDHAPIYVLDTPGLFDPNRSLSNMSKLLMSSLLGAPINVVYNVSCSSALIQKDAFEALKVFLDSSRRSRGRLLLNLSMFDDQYINMAWPTELDSTNVQLKHAYTVAYVMQRIIFPEKEFFLGLDPEDAGLMYTVNINADYRCIEKLEEHASGVLCTENNFSCAQAHLRVVQDILRKYNAETVSLWTGGFRNLLEFAEEIKDRLQASLTLWDKLPELLIGLVGNADTGNGSGGSSIDPASSISSFSTLDSDEAIELVL